MWLEDVHKQGEQTVWAEAPIEINGMGPPLVSFSSTLC